MSHDYKDRCSETLHNTLLPESVVTLLLMMPHKDAACSVNVTSDAARSYDDITGLAVLHHIRTVHHAVKKYAKSRGHSLPLSALREGPSLRMAR